MTIAIPHDLAAEEAVLGAVLLSNVALPKLIVDLGLTSDAFYRERHAKVWDAMVALAMKNETVDELTLGAELARSGSEVDLSAIGELSAASPNAGAVMSYGRRVIELAEWRQVLKGALGLQEAALAEDREARAVAEGLLMTATQRSDTRTPAMLQEDVWRHLEGHEVPAWRTPWPKLNSALGGGLRAGEVTLLGGWTSMGKSLITDQLLRWCGDKGAKVHLYSNEMSPTMRALRNVSAITGVPQATLAQPKKLTDEQRSKAVSVLPSLPFGITQVTDWSAEDIARDIRFRAWDVCALDLIHRIHYNDERDLARISSALNGAAQISGAHLIAVVHLNEGRATGATLPPPVLRDIRGSGMLKNDADNALFIHREEEDADGVITKTRMAMLYLAKCRNGHLENVPLELEGRRSMFLEPALTAPTNVAAREMAA